ncbi:tripartite tricarboxylate transporter substrate binding protein [Rhizobiaceae bacterium BDR2-2]|uniref:Tripartite tricarboxylate transporter substrate binding protein n=1 Tax=Ectorhizobium quercum TaxID=2965071 RepID=A0AAE3SX09_9HYPH|nr:tripartite tricarboxylate transporter substrate binding protein [Ectorhizobium quercum]MCX8997975.1 tripartite tricarboxylate transporter substrate binding protein [Ectorhizobium quercum]
MKLKNGRNIIRTALACLAALSFGAPASAETFPEKPITLVVAWPAGGGHDIVGRLVAEHLGKRLPVSIVVSNVPGAAGSTGVRQVEQAAPDGYTVGVMGLHAIAQSYMNPNATPLSRIAPLALVEKGPAALSVRADSGIGSLAEFIEKAKAEPNAIINSNDGPGGFAFLSAMLIQKQFDIELTTVPYQGFAPSVAALVSGESMSSTVPVPLVADLHNGGQVKILGVAAAERHFFAPDVPTFTEAGYPFEFSDFVGLFLPVGVPEDRVALLEKALLEAMDDDAFKEAAGKVGLMLAPSGAADMAAFIQQQDDAVYPVLDGAGLVKANKR